jgi:argonaute-like protein implicated in RNA metabolism and viral defense
VAFDTGIPIQVAEQISVGNFEKKWYLPANETAWIPIETTMLRKGDFGDAWKKGLERIEAGIINAIPVSLAQQVYKPADIYNNDKWKPELPSREKINQEIYKEQSLTWLENLSAQAAKMQKTHGYATDDDSEKGESIQ